MPRKDQFRSLANGTVDVLTAQITPTIEKEIRESTSGRGLAFSTPYFDGGITFYGKQEYVDCANRGDTTKATCSNRSARRPCTTGTTPTARIGSLLVIGGVRAAPRRQLSLAAPASDDNHTEAGFCSLEHVYHLCMLPTTGFKEAKPLMEAAAAVSDE